MVDIIDHHDLLLDPSRAGGARMQCGRSSTRRRTDGRPVRLRGVDRLQLNIGGPKWDG